MSKSGAQAILSRVYLYMEDSPNGWPWPTPSSAAESTAWPPHPRPHDVQEGRGTRGQHEHPGVHAIPVQFLHPPHPLLHLSAGIMLRRLLPPLSPPEVAGHLDALRLQDQLQRPVPGGHGRLPHVPVPQEALPAAGGVPVFQGGHDGGDTAGPFRGESLAAVPLCRGGTRKPSAGRRRSSRRRPGPGEARATASWATSPGGALPRPPPAPRGGRSCRP